VSLYNETNGAASPPTPTCGAVGLIADYATRADFSSMRARDALVLVGDTAGELGASMYLREIAGREDGAPPPVDLAVERRNGDFVRRLILGGQATVVHDLSDGGLIAAVAEMALASNVGAAVTASGVGALFGEDQARYLLAVADPAAVLAAAKAAGVPAVVVGQAGGESLSGPGFDVPLAKLRAAHEGWMPGYMGA
jgi:phosphoribosylformylglycinamidine synthase